MTTLTLRYIKGDFVVTGPDIEPLRFKTRREARGLVRGALPRRAHQRDRSDLQAPVSAERRAVKTGLGSGGLGPMIRHKRRGPHRGHFLTRWAFTRPTRSRSSCLLSTGHFGMCLSPKLSSGTPWLHWQHGP